MMIIATSKKTEKLILYKVYVYVKSINSEK